MATSPLRIDVEPRFLADQSAPDAGLYTFSYTITVTNTAEVSMQLIARHWMISDASGHTQEVKGLGVVGQQPLLKPGESFEYTSGCQLETPVGTMRGEFQVTAEDGMQFEAVVDTFTLSIPRVLH